MGFFGKIFKKKDDFDFGDDSPPDFSQGGDPFASNATGNEPFGGKDPLQQDFSYDAQGQLGQQGNQPGSNFDHDLFMNDRPTPGDNARNYAQSLSGPNPSQQGINAQATQQTTTTSAGAITGHEAELILERLDTIKAELDAIKQRMLRIERFMDSSEQTHSTQKRYF